MKNDKPDSFDRFVFTRSIAHRKVTKFFNSQPRQYTVLEIIASFYHYSRLSIILTTRDLEKQLELRVVLIILESRVLLKVGIIPIRIGNEVLTSIYKELKQLEFKL